MKAHKRAMSGAICVSRQAGELDDGLTGGNESDSCDGNIDEFEDDVSVRTESTNFR